MYIYYRPKVHEVLLELSKHFELIVFTAACVSYAEIVVDLIEEETLFFDYILHREQCLYVKEQKTFIKDLKLLSEGRDLKDMVLIDNKVKSYMLNMENGIPIKDFMGDPDDDTLPVLLKYLMKLLDVDDVRESIKKDFISIH
jgi:CTD small phosphatase-like protein 2